MVNASYCCTAEPVGFAGDLLATVVRFDILEVNKIIVVILKSKFDRLQNFKFP